MRQPHHPDIERWVERAYAASLAQRDPQLRMQVETRVALSIVWAGHYPKAWAVIQGMHSLIRQHEVSPFQLGMLKLTEATYYMLTADGEACLKSAREGVDIERAAGVRVQTHQFLAYGQFRLLRGGDPLTFAGKAQRRPLDLLRALIAYGGREVPEERITEALWPRIDGDSAHRSFTTTLHRLRKLLGEDRAVQLSEGKLTLDGRYVWVDTWAFEQVTARIEQMLRRPRENIDREKLGELCERMIELYACSTTRKRRCAASTSC